MPSVMMLKMITAAGLRTCPTWPEDGIGDAGAGGTGVLVMGASSGARQRPSAENPYLTGREYRPYGRGRPRHPVVAEEPAMSEWGFETRQIHAGAEPDPTTGARAVPIYQTTSYVFRDTDHAAALFGLAELGNIYTRIMNPTQAAFEDRMTALEGGVGALATSSGMAAQTIALLNLAENGGHIVSSASLYGGTYNQLHYTLPKLGVEVSFIDDPDDLDAWKDAIRPNTRAFYGESIGNPKGDIFDFEGVSAVAHDA